MEKRPAVASTLQGARAGSDGGALREIGLEKKLSVGRYIICYVTRKVKKFKHKD